MDVIRIDGDGASMTTFFADFEPASASLLRFPIVGVQYESRLLDFGDVLTPM